MLFLTLVDEVKALTKKEPLLTEKIDSLKTEYLIFVKRKALDEYHRTKFLLKQYSSSFRDKDKSYLEAYLEGEDDSYLGLENLTNVENELDHASRLEKIIQRIAEKRNSIPQLSRTISQRVIKAHDTWPIIILKRFASAVYSVKKIVANKVTEQEKNNLDTAHNLHTMYFAHSDGSQSVDYTWVNNNINFLIHWSHKISSIVTNTYLNDGDLFIVTELNRTVYYYQLLTQLHQLLAFRPSLATLDSNEFNFTPKEMSLIKKLESGEGISTEYDQLMTAFAKQELSDEEFNALDSLAAKIRENPDKFAGIVLPEESTKLEFKEIKPLEEIVTEVTKLHQTKKLANLNEEDIKNCLQGNPQDIVLTLAEQNTVFTFTSKEQDFLHKAEIKFKSRLLDLVREQSTSMTSKKRTSLFENDKSTVSYNLAQQIKRLALEFKARLEQYELYDNAIEEEVIKPALQANIAQRSPQELFDMLFRNLQQNLEGKLAKKQKESNKKPIISRVPSLFKTPNQSKRIRDFLNNEWSPELINSCFTGFHCHEAIKATLARFNHFSRALHWNDYKFAKELRDKISAEDFSQYNNYYGVINRLHEVLTDFQNDFRKKTHQRSFLGKRNPLTFGSSKIQHLSCYLDRSIKELDAARNFYAPLKTLGARNSDLKTLLEDLKLLKQPTAKKAVSETQSLPDYPKIEDLII